MRRDHPRRHRERFSLLAQDDGRPDPSPPARGAARPHRDPRQGRGSIPADAESSLAWWGGALIGAVPSPRARAAGDRPDLQRVDQGSIPARAGSRPEPAAPAGRRGFIPARTGSRAWRRPVRPFPRDHPRASGEQGHPCGDPGVREGPSPRQRGAALDLAADHPRTGSTPAGAGNRHGPRTGCRGRRDHPRRRGEQVRSCCIWKVASGPSPRVRGALLALDGGGQPVGSIPAYTGSSRCPETGSSARRDHPRTGREQRPVAASRPNSTGPSPQARGAVPEVPLPAVRVGPIPARAGADGTVKGVAGRFGSIPAHAGSRWCPARSTSPARGHPRGRGEQAGAPSGSAPRWGPSPRARGAVFLTCSSTRRQHAPKQLSPKQTKRPQGPPMVSTVVSNPGHGEFGGEYPQAW